MTRRGPRPDLGTVLKGEAASDVYVCGPATLIAAVGEAWRQLGHDAGRLHAERFSAEIDAAGAPFEVVAARSGVTVTVSAGQSVAEALRAAGIAVPVSCGQGVCGTCLVRVIAGTPLHRDLVQSEAEKATNDRVALCCSRAEGGLVIDL